MVDEHGFERIQPFADPMAHPFVALGLRHVPFAFEVLQHAQVVERVHVAGDHLRERTHALAVARGGGQQRGRGPHFIEVFEDRHRLPHHALAVFEHRHQALRIGRAEFGAMLFAAVAQQVHGGDLVFQALEVQADAYAIRGAGAPVGKQPQPIVHCPTLPPGAARTAAAPTLAGGRRARKPAHAPDQTAGVCRSMRWSMAPKMLLPAASNISMRTLSPKDRNGVTGLPVSSVSTVRFSAKHEAPFEVSWLAMVPEPTMVPADKGRVFAACATSWAKSNCMSTPASGAPNHWPFTWVTSGRWTLLPAHAASSSSGVTNTGDSAERGLLCRKPKPLASSAGIRLRSETSLTRPTSWMCAAAPSADTPIGTSSVTTTISASRSMPNSSEDTSTGSRGPRKPALTAWYISGSV